MRARGDAFSREPAERGDVPDRGPPVSVPARHREIQHLVEIAVVNLAVPSHADQRPAHQAFHSGRIEVVHQQRHVRVVLALLLKKRREALDGHVGDSEQAIELDAEGFAQLFLVVGLQTFLRRGRKASRGL